MYTWEVWHENRPRKVVETQVKKVYARIKRRHLHADKLIARKIELKHIYILILAYPYPFRYGATSLIA